MKIRSTILSQKALMKGHLFRFLEVGTSEDSLLSKKKSGRYAGQVLKSWLVCDQVKLSSIMSETLKRSMKSGHFLVEERLVQFTSAGLKALTVKKKSSL